MFFCKFIVRIGESVDCTCLLILIYFIRRQQIIKATKVKLKSDYGQKGPTNVIDEIYLENAQLGAFYKKAIVHDYLKLCPGAIQVNIPPYPSLIPVTSMYGEKCVRSTPDKVIGDNLLDLPQIYC